MRLLTTCEACATNAYWRASNPHDGGEKPEPTLAAMLHVMRLLSTSLALAALGACANDAPPVPEPARAAGLAVMVKLVRPAADGTTVATQVSETTARPARYVSSSGGDWHLVEVACRNPADCDLALQRLRSDATHIAAVQRDERKHIVTP